MHQRLILDGLNTPGRHGQLMLFDVDIARRRRLDTPTHRRRRMLKPFLLHDDRVKTRLASQTTLWTSSDDRCRPRTVHRQTVMYVAIVTAGVDIVPVVVVAVVVDSHVSR